MMNINMKKLKQNCFPLTGVCSGVYLLFNNDDLVYVGQSWNCFLMVAEQTRTEKIFTSWNFIPETDEIKQKDLKKKLITEYNTQYNRRL